MAKVYSLWKGREVVKMLASVMHAVAELTRETNCTISDGDT